MKLDAERWKVSDRSTKENRYIWSNKGKWWCAFTMVTEDGTQSVRVRFSLKTHDVELARRRRDRLIKVINSSDRPIEINM